MARGTAFENGGGNGNESLAAVMSRRHFLYNSGRVAAAAVIAGANLRATNGSAEATDQETEPESAAEGEMQLKSSADAPLEPDQPIDINDLSGGDKIYIGRESVSPDVVREAYESGSPEQFVGIFHTTQVEAMGHDGEINPALASFLFMDRLEMALNSFCLPEYLGDYINDSNEERFVHDMTANDLLIVKGLGGYIDDSWTDSQIENTNLYKLFHMAHIASLTQYFRKARYEGSLDGTVIIEPISADPNSEFGHFYTDGEYLMDVSLMLKNSRKDTGSDAGRISIEGVVPLNIDTVRYPEIIEFGIDLGPSTALTPLEQLSDRVA